MKGYWNKPEATAETFAGGWLRSGDLARLDEQGFVQIVDRKKDMVNRGGENVYCVEVENALAAHPAVFEVAVLGVPDEMMGEKVGAVIVLKPQKQADDAARPARIRPGAAGRFQGPAVRRDPPRIAPPESGRKDLEEAPPRRSRLGRGGALILDIRFWIWNCGSRSDKDRQFKNQEAFRALTALYLNLRSRHTNLAAVRRVNRVISQLFQEDFVRLEEAVLFADAPLKYFQGLLQRAATATQVSQNRRRAAAHTHAAVHEDRPGTAPPADEVANT